MTLELGNCYVIFEIELEQYCAPVMFELFYLVFLIESLEELIDLSNLSVRGGLL